MCIGSVPGIVGGYPFFPYARWEGMVAFIFCLKTNKLFSKRLLYIFIQYFLYDKCKLYLACRSYPSQTPIKLFSRPVKKIPRQWLYAKTASLKWSWLRNRTCRKVVFGSFTRNNCPLPQLHNERVPGQRRVNHLPIHQFTLSNQRIRKNKTKLRVFYYYYLHQVRKK